MAIVQADYSSPAGIALLNWVRSSVTNTLISTAILDLKADDIASVRLIVHNIKKNLNPSDTAELSTVRDHYRKALAKARSGSIRPLVWYNDWFSAYREARDRQLSDMVDGILAAKDFLEALQEKIAPVWATEQLNELLRDEIQNPTRCHNLEYFHSWFKILLDNEEIRKQQGSRPSGVFAYYSKGGNSSSNSVNSSATQGSGRLKCPCEFQHRWKPVTCERVHFALRGESDREGVRLSAERCTKVKKLLAESKYSDLRKELTDKGWLHSGDLPATSSSAGRSASSTTMPTKLSSTTIAAILDMRLQPAPRTAAGLYATHGSNAHPYRTSTLLDNCGGTHLVNGEELLEPGSIIYSREGDAVLCGSDTLPVLGRGRRVMRGVFDGEDGNGAHDLVLQHVALVPEFHVNIISEKLLRKSGLWYSGYDTTLRFGPIDNSVVVKTLVTRDNLTFFDLRETTALFATLDILPSSTAGVFATPDTSLIRKHRPSRDAPRP